MDCDRQFGSGRRPLAPWADPAVRPLIRIRNVERRFGAVTAVDNVSLDLFGAEMFCLLGPSGCGKTTLLRMLAGFEPVDAGSILLDEVDQAGLAPHQRQTNMMFQSYALFPHLTVAGNIGFGLKQQGLARPDISARVADLMTLVQIDGLADRKPHQLSGGQKQRVALARALACQPKVLLLDEPMAALDARIRAETQRELKQIQHRTGTTFIVVTHDQSEAMAMADRIGVMQGGRLVQVGTPADIYEHPVSRAVARFVGNINLFEAIVQGDNAAGEVVLTCPSIPCGLVAARPVGPLAPGQPVAVAVRPERMQVLSGRLTGAAPNVAHGVISAISYLGDLTVYSVRLADGVALTVSAVNDGRGTGQGLGWDAEVTVRFDPHSAMVLTA
ncbi:MAG: ABC transporter ATP-binding protein [Hyphomicrobiales bacterium]|nr:ABC transporter ATP-binding protein [Hyphomicrobiales bacterium]